MATAPMSAGQVKDLASALVQAIPVDLSSEIAQRWIGRKKELANKVRAIFLENLKEGLPDIDWAKTYNALGMGLEYSQEVKSPVGNPSFWTVPVIKGVTCNKVVAALRELGVNVYLYKEDLDKNVTENDRDPNNGSYLISFKRTVEADEENKNLSANRLKEQGHKGITLLERLLLGLGYLLTTGQHLDVNNWTLCSGSRDSGGNVPRVYWRSVRRRVYVNWCLPGNADGGLRSRAAVSLV